MWLSADDGLIEAARQRAASERTTLNEQFRRWLADYVGRRRQAAEAVHVMRYLTIRATSAYGDDTKAD